MPNGNPSKVSELEDRVKDLEDKVQMLILRTVGLVRLGGYHA